MKWFVISPYSFYDWLILTTCQPNPGYLGTCIHWTLIFKFMLLFHDLSIYMFLLFLLVYLFIYTRSYQTGLVCRGCRIHRLFFRRWVRVPQVVSRIWHKKIWWWGSINAGALENAEYHFITQRSNLANSQFLIGYYL